MENFVDCRERGNYCGSGLDRSTAMKLRDMDRSCGTQSARSDFAQFADHTRVADGVAFSGGNGFARRPACSSWPQPPEQERLFDSIFVTAKSNLRGPRRAPAMRAVRELAAG